MRPAWAKLLPAMLKPTGYRSYHSGKWHIDGMPIQNGFDRSYYMKDQSRFFNPKIHYEDDQKLPEVKKNSGFYITDAVNDHAIKYLKEHAAKHADKPFFCYVAHAAPHFPLHALPEDIGRYRDRYRKGWDAIRAARWKRVQAMGIANGKLSDVERNVGPPYHFPDSLKILGSGEVNRPVPWEKLTSEQRAFQTTKMAIHAAMIDRMDRGIGRVLDQIRAMKAFDNTLIMFLSDNGCSAEIMVRADGHDSKAPMGSAASYLCLGPGWSTACNTPFRRHKTWVHEGGCATPFVVHWPRGIAARGELRRNVGHAIDVVPTVLELAGAKRVSDAPAAPGKSLVNVFAKDDSVEREYLWWFHDGHRAIRMGDWKLVAAANDPWELFNLGDDRTESNNLAAKQPEKVRQLEVAWKQRMSEFRALAIKDAPVTRPPNRGKAPKKR